MGRPTVKGFSSFPENDFEIALQVASFRASSFDAEPWPIPVRPLPDELLSSWLMRLAMAHGVKLHTLARLTWPTRAVWNRDIDKLADEEFVTILARKTKTSLCQAGATTLSAYEGYLFETLNRFGPTSWVLPIGIYHRVRQRFGQQFCPLCLAEDREPYFRKRWRLAFMTCCEKHRVCLLDRCPECASPVNFHRNELGDLNMPYAVSITHCYKCSLNLSDLSVRSVAEPVTEATVIFTQNLLKGLAEGSLRISDGLIVYSHLFFAGLRQLMRVLATANARIDNLRRDLERRFGIQFQHSIRDICGSSLNVEELDVAQRYQLLNGARILLLAWPEVFTEVATKHSIWSSLWLKHLETINPRWGRSQRIAPFWFWSVVNSHLKRERYMPAEFELSSATQYLKDTRGKCSKKMLAEFFGNAIAYKRVRVK